MKNHFVFHKKKHLNTAEENDNELYKKKAVDKIEVGNLINRLIIRNQE